MRQTTDEVEARYAAIYGARPQLRTRRVPLTGKDHILYAILTVLTCGVFLPVWIYQSSRGKLTRTRVYL